MNGLFENPFLQIGTNILAANRPGVPFGQALGAGMLSGMQNLQLLQEAKQTAEARQLNMERIRAQMEKAKQDAAMQAEMQQRAMEQVEEDPELAGAYALGGREGAMDAYLQRMKEQNKVYQLSPGGMLVQGGEVTARAPFAPRTQGSVPEFQQVMDRLSTMAPTDPNRQLYESRARYLAGVAQRGSRVQPRQPVSGVDMSAKERADAREALQNAREGKEVIERIISKVQASGQELVGPRGQVRQALEGPVANILGIESMPVPATELAQDVGMLRSKMRVPMIGPGNPSEAEWRMLNKRIQGDDWRSSSEATVTSMQNLYDYLDQVEQYNAGKLGEAAGIFPQTPVEPEAPQAGQTWREGGYEYRYVSDGKGGLKKQRRKVEAN